MKRTVKIMLAVLGIILCGWLNADMVQAETEISPGEKYRLAEVGNDLLFSVPKDGRIKIHIENVWKDTNYGWRSQFYMDKYNVNTISYDSYIYQTFIDGLDMLESGYITLPDGDYSCKLVFSDNYTIKDSSIFIEYVPIDEYLGETESNNSFEQANIIQTNMKYENGFAARYDTDDKDYYKVSITKPGVFQIDVNANDTRERSVSIYSEDSNKNVENIYDRKCNGVLSRSFPDCRVPAGTYYVVLTGSGNYGTEYDMTVNYREETLEEFFEEERNNYRSEANPCLVNQAYVGNLNSKDDRDFFCFSLDEDSNVALELRIPRQTAANKCKVFLYPENSDDEIISLGSTENPYCITDPVELKAGKYYMYVSGSLDPDEQYEVAARVILEQLPQITSKGYTGIYDGNGHSITVSVPTGAIITYSLDGETFTPQNPSFKDVGEYTVYYRIKKTGYEEKNGSEKVIIKKNTFDNIVLNTYQGVYNGEEHSISIKVPEGAVITYSQDGVTFTPDRPSFKEVGTYKVYYRIEKDGYETVTGMGNITIRKVLPEDIVFTGFEGVYDGKAHAANISAPAGTKITYSVDGIDYTERKPLFTDAGTYSVYCKIMQTEQDYITGTLSVVIEKATPGITASNVVKTAGAGTFSLGAKTNAGTLEYSSSNSRIAQVDDYGRVTIGTNAAGQAVITIRTAASRNYNAASKNITVTVNPKGTSIKKVKSLKGRKAVVTWKRNSAVTGYEIQYSTNKKFSSGVKKTSVGKNKTLKRTLSKLKKNKTYYMRIRTYKKVSGTKYYSSWSGAKKIKIRK